MPHKTYRTCGPSWLCFCVLYEKSNQNSSAVFKKLDLDNDQHGDFYLLSSSFSIKCKYSTLISDWHRPLNWCPQGTFQVIPSHIHVFKSKRNQCILWFRGAGKIVFTFLLFSKDLNIKHTHRAVLIANYEELKECQMSFQCVFYCHGNTKLTE